MNFRPRFREEPEINLIPLIDVLLMALIFLLVTTSFSHEARLRLQLPEAGSDAKLENVTLRIAIDAYGQYFQAMQQAVGGRKDPVIVIQADRKTPHEAVVRVMDSARRLGYNQLTFATQAPGPDQ